jgi:hypothetical protein
MLKNAIIDPTGKYRYLLTRTWAEGEPHAVFIMLNPSTANAQDDDPTIRRCIRFAKDWGYGGLKVVNLFALISSDPAKLITEPDAMGGDENNWYIHNTTGGSAGIVVAAWGAFKEAKARSSEVLDFLDGKALYCLGVTKDGCPKHPLYIPALTRPKLMRAAIWID